jgi:peptidoglycan/LPS O-acetylase OafA/YrhL
MEQSLAPSAAKRTFHTLEGLRGVAALLVVAYHYAAFFAPFRVQSGYLAVDLFFVLSGFVLAYAYGERLRDGMGARRFMLVRLIRLYPLYLLAILVAALIPVLGLVLGVSEQWTWPSLLVALLPALAMLLRPPTAMIGAELNLRNPDALYPLNPPAWSLFYELAINLVFAATLRIRHRSFVPLVIGVSALALAAAIFARGSANAGWRWDEWWMAVPRVSFSFFVGVFFYRAYAGGSLPKLRCPPPLALAAAAVAIALGVPKEWRALYDLVCIAAVLPLSVWLCICNEPERGIRFYSVLGLISYPLYITHESYHYPVDRILYHLVHARAEAFAAVDRNRPDPSVHGHVVAACRDL